MDNQGFYIKEIAFTGPDFAEASLSFTKGLNIIAGSSDTGKSFILETIDYMLGAGRPLSEIQQLKKYNSLEMEIRTISSESSFTLRRNLTLGPFYIRNGGINSSGEEKRFSAKSSDKNEMNISSFLLQILGLNDIRLKTSNKTKSNRKLSFRDVARITLIDEVKMFAKDSPLLSGIPTNKQAELSLFEYLISQKDSSQLVKVEKEEIRKTRLSAQIDYVNARIKEDGERLIGIESSLGKSNSIGMDELTSINEKYAAYFQELESNKLERKKAIEEKIEIESEILYNCQLLERFALLLDHYDADKERLEFIDEGNNLFNLLEYVACPICGTQIEEQHYKCIQDSELQSETLNEAIESEYHKIRQKTLDLKQTVSEIEIRNEGFKRVLNSVNYRINKLDEFIDQKILPVITGLKHKIDTIVGQELLIKEKKRLEDDLEALAKDLEELELEKKKKQIPTILEPLPHDRIKLFEDEVKQLLRSWKFDDVSEVTYDPSKSDIRIDGKNRGSYGKGYRAVAQSAFIVGLMRFLTFNGNQFSKLLVLDSPLTAYKKQDQPPADEEQITAELEAEFFRGLMEISSSCQIIILENKEPPSEIIEKANYVHFSRNVNVGRPGFL